jgi:hypothetical protein
MGKKKSRRGFASMDPEKARAIASKGGKAAHARGTANTFTHEAAVAAVDGGASAGRSRTPSGEFLRRLRRKEWPSFRTWRATRSRSR